MDYWQKLSKNPFDDLTWNLPEVKQGSVSIFGGNDKSFNTEIRISEKFLNTTKVKDVKLILPDTLKNKLPPVENILFVKATDSGSLADSPELTAATNISDFNLFIGDFSKNSITEQAVGSACVSAEKPTLLTRDTVDLIANGNPEELLEKESVIIFASMVQLQKLFHAALYPKMILLSMSLMQATETLHKFTVAASSSRKTASSTPYQSNKLLTHQSRFGPANLPQGLLNLICLIQIIICKQP